jgi:hypothetical protein
MALDVTTQTGRFLDEAIGDGYAHNWTTGVRREFIRAVERESAEQERSRIRSRIAAIPFVMGRDAILAALEEP